MGGKGLRLDRLNRKSINSEEFGNLPFWLDSLRNWRLEIGNKNADWEVKVEGGN